MIEKREHPRVNIQIEVNYQNLDIFYRSTVLNISQGGMFIKTDSPLPLGTEIALEFSLPGKKQMIHAQGKVVWHLQPTGSKISSREPGMGIKLMKIKPDDLALIRNYIEDAAAKKGQR